MVLAGSHNGVKSRVREHSRICTIALALLLLYYFITIIKGEEVCTDLSKTYTPCF